MVNISVREMTDQGLIPKIPPNKGILSFKALGHHGTAIIDCFPSLYRKSTILIHERYFFNIIDVRPYHPLHVHRIWKCTHRKKTEARSWKNALWFCVKCALLCFENRPWNCRDIVTPQHINLMVAVALCPQHGKGKMTRFAVTYSRRYVFHISCYKIDKLWHDVMTH